jgi:hypothetical protein
VLIAVGGWMNQRHLLVIDYLREENVVLREQLGNRRLRLGDDQRRGLAAKAKGLARKVLADVAAIATPETLLAWHRNLIGEQYDGSGSGSPKNYYQGQNIGTKHCIPFLIGILLRVWPKYSCGAAVIFE